MCLFLSLQLISSSQVLSNGEESSSDPGEEPQPSGALVFEEMCTFSMEMDIIRHLDQALELWKNVPTNEHTESSLRSVMLCSSILRLTGKVHSLRTQICMKIVRCVLMFLIRNKPYNFLPAQFLISVNS